MNEIAAARAEVARLEQEEKTKSEERAKPHQLKREARNHLAYLTAIAYVVVEVTDLNHDDHVEIFGVSKEVTSGSHGVDFRIDQRREVPPWINVRSSGWHGTEIVIFLLPGERTCFKVSDRKESITHSYTVSAFASKEEAEAAYDTKKQQLASRMADLENELRN